MNFQFFIGVDVSKLILDFAVSTLSETIFHIQVSNSKEGINSFVTRCKKRKNQSSKISSVHGAYWYL